MNILSTSISYFHGVIAELKKVTFPSRRQVIVGTILVIAAIMLATLVIGGVDTGLAQLVRIFIIERGGVK
ncbi:preprotein translocase subunit SecE [Candidatus Berkelbacteria bacterium]|uniref:Protein translocase subunit SecE n=1 Tax=Candidatus Berkelbacteria bacterium CG10_big_fil_rev_8_21_14_0_10_43_14 TaxID=1974515 RepID=A0A2M6R961_9BACT|nr:preprotein translocase subunit SecE [Candidatus Berkelbacteria bacterium]OIP07126.1 MAG: preprotein translocase subunit SecE [Candidatus Berkelbacteria bacterium CG2_30_43_20]PIS07063.1 MAG: preprotein translocase subunit SecE [Candidatus Berkelbacteria bacterium CG10_big_fil_rev_8_21_14_0_10_43_14]PIU87286.1 MAG: preprotein translocase subunit SecE [Candidatus Berkelbacteria bacterium CG06_land_8_20_14_3_00_43_10]